MKEDYYRIRICKAPFDVIMPGEQYFKYKVFWEGIYRDEFGRAFSKIWQCKCYNSLEDMEADFEGYIQFIEYDDEIDWEEEYDKANY